MAGGGQRSREELQAERDAALRDYTSAERTSAAYQTRLQKLGDRERALEHRPESRSELEQVQSEKQRYQHAALNSEEKRLQAESRYHESQHQVDGAIRAEAGSQERLSELQAEDRSRRGRIYAESANYNYDSPEVRKNMDTAMEYHDRHGSSPGDVHGWTRGSDLHKPVRVQEANEGHEFSQRVRDSGRPGQYVAGRGESADRTGIADTGRSYHTGKANDRVEYLESSAAPIKDTWTERGKTHETRGGAQQQYVGRGEMHKVDWKGREDRESAFERQKADAQWEKMTAPEKEREAPSR